MRIAGEKKYELRNGESVRIVTDDMVHVLDKAWQAAGNKVPMRFNIMFEIGEDV